MAKITVWDYPVRIFHWILALGFFSAIGLAEFAPEHSQLFDVHMLVGLALVPIVVLRILWGFIGTKYARLASFFHAPKDVLDYLIGTFTLKGKRYVGHNPAASYAALALLTLLLAVVTTGLAMQRGEVFEEMHGALAYVMLAVVAAHICGVVLHVVRHKENIILSMFTGTKEGEEQDAIRSARPAAAIVFLLVLAAYSSVLVRGYSRDTRRLELPIVGQSIQLGEQESHGDEE